MTKRQEAAEATRNKLIETADRLISEQGYENISVEDITKASGVAKGTFYNYFKKKEDITLALSKKHLANLTDVIPKLSNKNPEEGIRYYLNKYLEVVVASGDKMARQWIRYVVEPANYQKWEFDLDSLKLLLNNMIVEKQLKDAAPVNDLAQLLMTEIYGIIFSWCISPKTVDPIQDVNKFCDLQLGAILKDYLV